MCDRCITASGKLDEMLTELENQFPGEEVQGTKVDRNHHVVASVVNWLLKQPFEVKAIAAELLARELTGEMLQRLQQQNPQAGAFVLGGGSKDIEV